MNKQVQIALAYAGLILGLSIGVKAAQQLGVIDLSAERVAGVINGIVLVFFGNVLPKTGDQKRGCGDTYRMRRFAGVVLMLAGVAHAAIWLLGPAATAGLWSMVPVASAVVILLLTFLWTRKTAG